MNLTNEKLLESLNWRYATKAFDPTKKVSKEDWHALEEVLRLSPSSYGLQPWQFIVVDSPDVRAKLKPFTWGQSQVVDASHVVVFTVRKLLDAQHIDAYLDHMAEVRGVPKDSLAPFRGMLMNTLKTPEIHKE